MDAGTLLVTPIHARTQILVYVPNCNQSILSATNFWGDSTNLSAKE